MKNFNIKFNAATTVGSREMNQDIFLVNNIISSADTTEKQYFEGCCPASDDISVFAVCDGVGSFNNSGFAAHAALSKIKELVEEHNVYFKPKTTESTTEKEDADSSENKTDTDEIVIEETIITEKVDLKAWVLYALSEAKDAMLKYCREKKCNGATSTIAMLVIRDDDYVFANIGDSPCYLRNGQGDFKELSLKHNLASYKRLMNIECQESDERVLLYHLGDKSNDVILTANIVNGKIDHKDAFIVCSDGVATALGTEVICNKLSEQTPSYKFVTEAAKAQDADNCTAITIYVEELNTEAADASEVTEAVEESVN